MIPSLPTLSARCLSIPRTTTLVVRPKSAHLNNFSTRERLSENDVSPTDLLTIYPEKSDWKTEPNKKCCTQSHLDFGVQIFKKTNPNPTYQYHRPKIRKELVKGKYSKPNSFTHPVCQLLPKPSREGNGIIRLCGYGHQSMFLSNLLDVFCSCWGTFSIFPLRGKRLQVYRIGTHSNVNSIILVALSSL